MSTDTQVAPPDAKLDEGDHDRFSHYVIGGGEALMKSAVTGEPGDSSLRQGMGAKPRPEAVSGLPRM